MFDQGVEVRDGFLTPPRVQELVRCAALRRDRGDFTAARVGGAGREMRRDDIRGDATCWLAEPLFDAERTLLVEFEALRLELNRNGILGLFELELHYAWYPPGGGYHRHVDQPVGRGQRRVSVILYLNADWPEDAGGQLRMFDAEGYRDIEPAGGRLVCFLSADREHEVLPTHRDRLSLTGWFRSRG